MLRRLNVIIGQSLFRLRNPSATKKSSFPHKFLSMQEGFVEINSVPTRIFTWGQWIQDTFNENTKELILVISGNPGLAGFYTIYCDALYNELEKKIPVWVIGHAGHDEPKESEIPMIMPKLKGNEDLYNLKGQLDHKIEFINKYVPDHVNIHLVGHSVGAKLSMDLLKIPEFSNKVLDFYLMFPAIEKIADSEKGRLMKYLDKIFFMYRIMVRLLAILPQSWRLAIIKWQHRKEDMPMDFLEHSIEYIKPSVIDKIWFMAMDEMDKIKELDEESVKQNMHRMKFYYTKSDPWVRSEFYYDLIQKFPGIDAQLCKYDYEHAFVLKHGPEVGKMMADWIKDRKLKRTDLLRCQTA